MANPAGPVSSSNSSSFMPGAMPGSSSGPGAVPAKPASSGTPNPVLAGNASIGPGDNPTAWVKSICKDTEEVSKVTITAVGGPIQGYDVGGTSYIMGQVRCKAWFTNPATGDVRDKEIVLKYYTQLPMPAANDPKAMQETRKHLDTLVKTYCYFHEMASDPTRSKPTDEIHGKIDQIVANGAISVKLDLQKLAQGDLSATHKIVWRDAANATEMLTMDYVAQRVDKATHEFFHGQVSPAEVLSAGERHPWTDARVRDEEVQLLTPAAFQGSEYAEMDALAKRTAHNPDSLEKYLPFVEKEIEMGVEHFSAAQARLLYLKETPVKEPWHVKWRPGHTTPPPTEELVPTPAYEQFLQKYEQLQTLKQIPAPTQDDTEKMAALKKELEPLEEKFAGALPLMKILADAQQQRYDHLIAVRRSIGNPPPPPWDQHPELIARLDGILTKAFQALHIQTDILKDLEGKLKVRLDENAGSPVMQGLSKESNRLFKFYRRSLKPEETTRFYEALFLHSQEIRLAERTEDPDQLRNLRIRERDVALERLKDSKVDEQELQQVKADAAAASALVEKVLARALFKWYHAPPLEQQTLERDVQEITDKHPSVADASQLELLEHYHLQMLTKTAETLAQFDYQQASPAACNQQYIAVHDLDREINRLRSVSTKPWKQRELRDLQAKNQQLKETLIAGGPHDQNRLQALEQGRGDALPDIELACAYGRALFLHFHAATPEERLRYTPFGDEFRDTYSATELRDSANQMLKDYAVARDPIIQQKSELNKRINSAEASVQKAQQEYSQAFRVLTQAQAQVKQLINNEHYDAARMIYMTVYKKAYKAHLEAAAKAETAMQSRDDAIPDLQTLAPDLAPREYQQFEGRIDALQIAVKDQTGVDRQLVVHFGSKIKQDIIQLQEDLAHESEFCDRAYEQLSHEGGFILGLINRNFNDPQIRERYLGTYQNAYKAYRESWERVKAAQKRLSDRVDLMQPVLDNSQLSETERRTNERGFQAMKVDVTYPGGVAEHAHLRRELNALGVQGFTADAHLAGEPQLLPKDLKRYPPVTEEPPPPPEYRPR